VRSNELANRIEDLATKRLLPLEMLSALLGPDDEHSLKPAGVSFNRLVTDSKTGLYTVVIDAQTNNAGEVSLYESALKKLPAVEDASAQIQSARGDLTTFRLVVKFKPGAIKPDAST
jgi:hypothetical protein